MAITCGNCKETPEFKLYLEMKNGGETVNLYCESHLISTLAFANGVSSFTSEKITVENHG